ncbi:MAG TPA: MerR family transcriptional regulator [Rhodoglobus sp.]|nr:MerR family transcriptional regulator [Rhodoglobus sp.]
MRISELSERAGVSPASIKYYTREGLLPGGERTGYNQTEYDEGHVARLRLIRILIDAGGLSVSAAQRVLAAIDDEDLQLPSVFEAAQHAIPQREAPASAAARARVAALIEQRGWMVHGDNPGIELAGGILDAYTAIDRDDLAAVLPQYAEAADIVAAADLDALDASGSREAMAETVVVGTVLGDSLLAGLRRIAQQHQTYQRYIAPRSEQQS